MSLSFSLAILLLGLLLIYAGVKGHSLRHAVFGQAVPGGQGKIIGG
jgi:hypothetical protein